VAAGRTGGEGVAREAIHVQEFGSLIPPGGRDPNPRQWRFWVIGVRPAWSGVRTTTVGEAEQ
jgi:hypothetical protein